MMTTALSSAAGTAEVEYACMNIFCQNSPVCIVSTYHHPQHHHPQHHPRVQGLGTPAASAIRPGSIGHYHDGPVRLIRVDGLRASASHAALRARPASMACEPRTRGRDDPRLRRFRVAQGARAGSQSSP